MDGIDKLAGVHAVHAVTYTRLPVSYGRESEYLDMCTIEGSSDALRRILSDKEQLSHGTVCSLSIDHVSPDTIGRLVNASMQDTIAYKHRGTIGLNLTLNQYFCCKSTDCILSMLKYLADFSNPAIIVRPFSLKLMTNPVTKNDAMF